LIGYGTGLLVVIIVIVRLVIVRYLQVFG
jgi:hypothetical protein